MDFIPFAFREKAVCATCGTVPITPMQGDCVYTQGKVFCTLDCRITFRWRKKFRHLEPTKADARFQHHLGVKRKEAQ